MEEQIHRNLRFQSNLQDSLTAKLIGEAEYWSLLNYYEAKLCCLHEELSTIQKKLIFGDCSMPSDDVWKDSFLGFKNLSTLDRKAVLLMVEQIRLLSKTEIDIRFTYQSEYEQAVSYLEQRGYDYGAKEQKTK